MIPRIPRATYRLQLNHTFTLAAAARVIPYLHELGVSHCYVSPLLKARPGSMHGYDIVDHHLLNPETGSREDFDRFVAVLHEYDMGLLLDIVPNHMGIGGSDNNWWLDVLENGPASPYAEYFDIAWYPISPFLRGKVLLPILGDHYGKILENGEIELRYDDVAGTLHAGYYEHLLPIDPRTYPSILNTVLDSLRRQQPVEDILPADLASLIIRLTEVSPRYQVSEPKRQIRRQRQQECKQLLAELSRIPAMRAAIRETLDQYNRQPLGQLHRLLEKQAYRLAYWRVAADDINYRRFFNINSLAGLRMERADVFANTHSLILDMIGAGQVQGLRIDHPDGLFDPFGYLQRLSRAVGKRLADNGNDASFYLAVEKILASYEYLPSNWPVAGTTGYDFAGLLNEFLVCQENEQEFSRIYQQFTGREQLFENLVYDCKKLIIKVQLSSELTVLTNLLRQLAEMDLRTRDYTFNGLREALTEVVACFPIYRTYITPGSVAESDRKYVDWAISQAKKRSPAADVTIFDFVRALLLEPGNAKARGGAHLEAMRFAMKFQQYTAPVMAKAVEDTVFYNSNRLVSLNEVGGDPQRFGISLAAFHRVNQLRLQHWPDTMLATTTHDTKRSEDVRARIHVLSEMPDKWREQVLRWQQINRRHGRMIQDRLAPDANDEYLFYQTLVGVWPLTAADDEQDVLRQRIEEYMIKAVKEAKANTSWINPDLEYEEAVAAFVQAVLQSGPDNLFLEDFLVFHREIMVFGLLNSLAQTLLKLTVPGIPDIYQGNELWSFCLVDPDNRRPVDFAAGQDMLTGLKERLRDEDPLPLLRTLMAEEADGRLKMLVTWLVLQFRQKHPLLFERGDYQPLQAEGPLSEALCVFARQYEGKEMVVVVPRFFARRMPSIRRIAAAANADMWREMKIPLPGTGNTPYRNLFTGEMIEPVCSEGERWLAADTILGNFPIALLSTAAP